MPALSDVETDSSRPVFLDRSLYAPWLVTLFGKEQLGDFGCLDKLTSVRGRLLTLGAHLNALAV